MLAFFTILLARTSAAIIDLQWDVASDDTRGPSPAAQPVITINGKFPGPLINATTNDIVRVNVFNNLDEPMLFTWYDHYIQDSLEVDLVSMIQRV